MLATGASYSVVPRFIRDRLNLVIKPVSGTKGIAPTWCGVPCTFGRVMLWLPADDAPSGYRDFSLLTLLPTQDVPDAPPYVLLGAQFLTEYRARTILDCDALSAAASIVVP